MVASSREGTEYPAPAGGFTTSSILPVTPESFFSLSSILREDLRGELLASLWSQHVRNMSIENSVNTSRSVALAKGAMIVGTKRGPRKLTFSILPTLENAMIYDRDAKKKNEDPYTTPCDNPHETRVAIVISPLITPWLSCAGALEI